MQIKNTVHEKIMYSLCFGIKHSAWKNRVQSMFCHQTQCCENIMHRLQLTPNIDCVQTNYRLCLKQTSTVKISYIGYVRSKYSLSPNRVQAIPGAKHRLCSGSEDSLCQNTLAVFILLFRCGNELVGFQRTIFELRFFLNDSV